jgi:hypothetical protein
MDGYDARLWGFGLTLMETSEDIKTVFPSLRERFVRKHEKKCELVN